MSKILGHKVQLALAVLKARKVELMQVLNCINSAPAPAWTVQQFVNKRIDEIDLQIKEINERVNK